MLRIPRMVRTDHSQKTVFHVNSRTALDGLPFKDAEKDELVRVIKRFYMVYAVEVLGFPIMGNKADGSIQMGASLFEQVDGQWKTTYPLVDDKRLMGRLQKKLDYIRPDEIFSAEGRFFPSTFSRDWVARLTTEIENKAMGAQVAEEINLICVLGNITDLQGNPIAPDAVEFESLLANHVVKAGNPRLLGKEQVGENPHLSMYEGAVLICSFNQYQLLKSLDSFEAESDVTVFGRLKNDTPFQARVRIKTVPFLAK